MKRRTIARSLFNRAALFALAACTLGRAAPESNGAEFFEKTVRPLFAQRCLPCHAAGEHPAGGLSLDSRESLLQGGSRGPAIVAGRPEESLLIRALRQTSNLRMPPGGKLGDAEIAILANWVLMGAPWASARALQSEKTKATFWAFIPPKDPAIPLVKNASWVKSPIDAFILAGLEAKNLEPAPPAAKRELIRRATFDLTGLPPTPEEVQAFLDDRDPNAFERVVDRLLASPRYGERWGRHWLDVARYADSNGLDENLVYSNAFRYRDYVIQAFNKDKPYDQFVREQLAGDLLPDAKDLATTFERWTATGFLSLGAKMLAEDDPVKMEMDIVDEQLDTASRAFMAVTIGCARCHDHKFDPIPQADYYSMAGIFKSSKTMENFKVVARWHEYVLAPPEDRARLQAHEAKIEAKSKEIDRLTRAENRKLADEAQSKVGDYLSAASDVLRYAQISLKPATHAGKAPSAEVRAAGSFDRGNAPRQLKKGETNVPSGEKGPFFAEYDVSVARAGNYQVDLLEEETGGGTADILINGALMKKGAKPVENRAASEDAGGWSVAGIFPFSAGRNTVRLENKSRFPYFEKLSVAPSALPVGTPVPKTDVQVAREYGINPGFLDHWAEEMSRAKGAPHSVLFAWYAFQSSGSLDYKSLSGWTSPAAKLFQGFHPKTREELAARYQELFRQADREWQILQTSRPHSNVAEAEGEMEDPAKKDSKEMGLPDASLDSFRELLYAKAGPFRAPEESQQYFPVTVQWQLAQLEKEHKELEAARSQYPQAMGVCEGTKIGDLPIHIRGSHWTLGETVPRQFPRAIAGENQPAIPAGQSGRLQLAQWLTRPDHPLTGRVMANRIWRWHFGRGIVPSVDNFGRLGEPPSNLPLLDWLALRFVEHEWSVKEMHRLMMLSNTYQMSTAHDARAAEIDPENTLLWRMNRRRLEAEEIRDAIMAVSGNLDLTAGGSILTYKDREYVSDTEKRGGGDYDRNRRAVYMPVVRSSMYEVFQAFDLPDPSTSNGDRNATVIAPQALFMMNGSVVLKHTGFMAEKLLARTDLQDAGRVRSAYERALGRSPSGKETDRALSFIAQVDGAMANRIADPVKRRIFAWQSFCKSLIGSNEFIYLN
jgi:hypothetical protein